MHVGVAATGDPLGYGRARSPMPLIRPWSLKEEREPHAGQVWPLKYPRAQKAKSTRINTSTITNFSLEI